MSAPTDERPTEPLDARPVVLEPADGREAQSIPEPPAAKKPARAKPPSRKRSAPGAKVDATAKRKRPATPSRPAAPRRRKSGEATAAEPGPAATDEARPPPAALPAQTAERRPGASIGIQPSSKTAARQPRGAKPAVPTARPLPPYRALLRAVHRWLPDPTARLERVRTAQESALDGLAVVGSNLSHAEPCRPSPRAVLRKLLDTLPGPLEQTTFVDIGSGRGRVVFEAAAKPFAHVLGIEFAEALHEDATLNLRHWPRARMRCRDVDFVCADALEAPLPAGDLAVYLFDPFDERMTLRMAARLAEHARSARVTVILVGIRDLTVFRESTAFTELPLPRAVSVWLRLFSPYPVHVFEARPPRAAAAAPGGKGPVST